MRFGCGPIKINFDHGHAEDDAPAIVAKARTKRWSCHSERFSSVHFTRRGGRTNGIFAGQLDRSSAYCRGAATSRSARCLLEDVHDRDPTGSNPGAAGLFLEPDPKISFDFPARRK